MNFRFFPLYFSLCFGRQQLTLLRLPKNSMHFVQKKLSLKTILRVKPGNAYLIDCRVLDWTLLSRGRYSSPEQVQPWWATKRPISQWPTIKQKIYHVLNILQSLKHSSQLEYHAFLIAFTNFNNYPISDFSRI